MRKTITLTLLFVCCIFFLSGQRRKSKYEYLGGIGTSFFLGDLGGANQVGTHFIKDLDLVATRPVLYGGIRLKTHPIFAFKGVLTLGILRGDDKWTAETFRQNRNLNFRAPFAELSAQAEFYFIRERVPKLYSFKNLKKKKQYIGAYGFIGLGGLFFVPQGRYEGKWHNLKPMSTEGQGLPGGPKPYSLVTICVPYGLGMKYGINKNWSIGAEFGLRLTFTDYLDDVSTNYYDKQTLIDSKGITAANLADPSNGDIYFGTASGGGYLSGVQRGNPKDNDSYAFLQFNAAYKIYKARKRRTRSKF